MTGFLVRSRALEQVPPGAVCWGSAERYDTWVEIANVPEGLKRWDFFTKLETPVLVHSKLWGKYKKMMPVDAIGIAKDAYDVKLLVHDRVDGQVREINAYETSEGFKFRRSVIRLLKELLRVSREVQKIRKSEAAKAKLAAERAHKEGQCPCCFKDFIVKTGKIVFHGYERPGIGYTIGECFGVKYPPLEVSKEGLVAFIEQLHKFRTTRKENLEALKVADEVFRGARWLGDTSKTFKKGDKEFDAVKKDLVWRAERELQAVEQDIAVCKKVEKEWAPRPFPRKAA